MSRRFFWERSLVEMPHCVVFVFDGSSDPFLDAESLKFFQEVFEDCTKMGEEMKYSTLALHVITHSQFLVSTLMQCDYVCKRGATKE